MTEEKREPETGAVPPLPPPTTAAARVTISSRAR